MSRLFSIPGVTGIPVPNGDHAVEIGYIIIPTGVERDAFVETCQKNMKVSVVTERNGSVIHNCFVTEQVFQNLSFPLDDETVGTPIIMIRTIFNEKPVIVGTLPEVNKGLPYEEGVYKKIVQDDEGTFLVQASLKDGTFLINIDGTGQRKLCINVNGEDSSIELNTNGSKTEIVDGDVTVKSFKQVSTTVIDVEAEKESNVVIKPTSIEVTTADTIAVSVTDPESGDASTITMDKNTITLDPNKKMIVKGGAEPIPLGDTLKSILEKINANIDTLKTAWSTGSDAVTPAANGSPTGGGGSAFAAGKGAVASVTAPDLSKLNSEISFTD